MVHEKKFGELELLDPEVAKTNFLCKWIVKAMDHGKSNLQLMLRYRLRRFNPQRGRKWELVWIDLPVNNTKDSLAPRFGVTLVKPGRLW